MVRLRTLPGGTAVGGPCRVRTSGERAEGRELTVTQTVGEKRPASGRSVPGTVWTLGVRRGQGPPAAHGVLTACEPLGTDPDGGTDRARKGTILRLTARKTRETDSDGAKLTDSVCGY